MANTDKQTQTLWMERKSILAKYKYNKDTGFYLANLT